MASAEITRVVNTTTGAIRGRVEGAVSVFRGIPYAAPPTGARRFRAPQPPIPWSGVRNAVDYGPIAAQIMVPRDESAPPLTGYFDRDASQDEDSLLLHVWTPGVDRRQLPVMVWLHGGAYWGGAGHGAWSDGALLAQEEDVIVVSLNHRVHVFGFVSLCNLGGAEFADSNNAGLFDIIAALQWVRDNIAVFGGDPANVTLFGESGGGWKASILLGMPAAKGLFHKAIVQSGSMLRALSEEQADDAARRLLRRLEIPEHRADRLREVSTEQILAAASRQVPSDSPATIHADGTLSWNFDFAPIVDHRTLPYHPFHPDAAVESAGVPMLIGTTRDEFGATVARGTLPELKSALAKAERLGMPVERARPVIDNYRAEWPGGSEDDLFGEFLSDTLMLLPSIRQLEAKVRQGSDPVYAYLFAWEWAQAGGRAVHAADVAFAFGNVEPDFVSSGDQAASTKALSLQMRRAWAAFARTGDPNHKDLPVSHEYDLVDRATMIFDSVCRLEYDPRRARRVALSGPTK